MQREHHPKNLKTVPAGNQNSLIKKASAQSRAKALKIMRFLGLVTSQGGLFHLPENTFLKKVLQKKVVQKVPSPETHINTGLFGTSKPKGTTPTLFLDYRLSYFSSISSHFSAVLALFFFILFSLSSLVLQNMLQL